MKTILGTPVRKKVRWMNPMVNVKKGAVSVLAVYTIHDSTDQPFRFEFWTSQFGFIGTRFGGSDNVVDMKGRTISTEGIPEGFSPALFSVSFVLPCKFGHIEEAIASFTKVINDKMAESSTGDAWLAPVGLWASMKEIGIGGQDNAEQQ